MVGEFLRQLALVIFAIMPFANWFFGHAALPFDKIVEALGLAVVFLVAGIPI